MLALEKLKTLKDFNPEGKIVMVRTDYNVPIEDGIVVNDFRIRQSLPTIKYLLDNNVKRMIILSHLKNPDGYDKAFSLLPVKERLQELLNHEIQFVDLDKLFDADARIVMVENIRFWNEKQNDENLAKFLSEFADVYVFDAFSVAHRKHTTTWMLMEFLPSYAGFLVEKELKELNKIFNPEKPFLAIIGGAKISTKLGTIKVLAKYGKVFVGGAMIFTLMKMLNQPVGRSLVEDSAIDDIKKIWNEIQDNIILPQDFVVISDSTLTPFETTTITEDAIAYDIGTKSLQILENEINNAKFIVWNGPMGKFEDERFEKGTRELVKMLEKSCAYKIVGGGETIEVIELYSSLNKFNHVSTGGGAMLKFIENPLLPGLVHLFKND